MVTSRSRLAFLRAGQCFQQWSGQPQGSPKSQPGLAGLGQRGATWIPAALALTLGITGAGLEGLGLGMAPGWAQTAPSATLLANGDEGEDVARLQRRLAELGFFQGDATGVYGPLTEEAVIRYQSAMGLLADGVAGPETLGRLFGQAAPAAIAPSLDPNQISDLQTKLARLGFYLGSIDGVYGPQSEAAINSFQSIYSLPVTGQADFTTLDTLDRIYNQTIAVSPAPIYSPSPGVQVPSNSFPNPASGQFPLSQTPGSQALSSQTPGSQAPAFQTQISSRTVPLPPAIPSGPSLTATIPQTQRIAAPILPPATVRPGRVQPSQGFSLPPLAAANSGSTFSSGASAVQPVAGTAGVAGYPYVVAVPIKTGATLGEVRQVLADAFLAGSKRGLYIQAGAYGSRGDAEQVTQLLRDRRIDARVVYRPR
ncbi:MAG: hypothetical protein HC824_10640 [Synechococcales cyanobacterium RM1_1_8]|nr:hypothetical protein [Synechococcales cyanobacterium RM1_1_8]